MKLDELLAKLQELKVTVDEKRVLADGRTVYLLTSFLNFFPLQPHHRFYSLVIEKDQNEVDASEVEAMLRHFWHAEAQFDRIKH
jgi:hypothetical protein